MSTRDSDLLHPPVFAERDPKTGQPFDLSETALEELRQRAKIAHQAMDESEEKFLEKVSKKKQELAENPAEHSQREPLRQKTMQEAREKLVIRMLERGMEIPQEVKDQYPELIRQYSS